MQDIKITVDQDTFDAVYTLGYKLTNHANCTSGTSTIITTDYKCVWKEWCTGYATSTSTKAWHEWIVECTDGLYTAEHRCRANDDCTGTLLVPVLPRIEPCMPVDPQPTEADKKAEVLLRGILTPQQIADYEQHKRFDVVSQSGKVYRLNRGVVRNVVLLDASGKSVRGFCIHPRETVPVADVLVAQKLLIEADEKRFLETANSFALN